MDDTRGAGLRDIRSVVLRALGRRGVPRDAAEDAAQEALLHLVELKRGLRCGPARTEPGWCVSTALNAYRDNVRGTRRRIRREAQWVELMFHEIQDDELFLDGLWDGLLKLPKELWWPLILASAGRTQQSIAQELGWPVGTVKTRLKMARKLAEREFRSHMSRCSS